MIKSILKIRKMLISEKIPHNFNVEKYGGEDYYFLHVLPKNHGISIDYFMVLRGDSKKYNYLFNDCEYCEIVLLNYQDIFGVKNSKVKKVYNTDGIYQYPHFYISTNDAYKIIKAEYLKGLN